MVAITLLQFRDYLRESLRYLRAIAMPADLDNPAFQDDDLAREWFEARIWPDGPVCTHCGATGEGRHEMIGKKHRVGAFSITRAAGNSPSPTGTVLERSHIGLHIWLKAMYLLSASKKR